MYTAQTPTKSEMVLKRYFREMMAEGKVSPETGKAFYAKGGKYNPNSNVYAEIDNDATHVVYIAKNI